MKAYTLLYAVLFISVVSGCVYTHTVQPLTVNMHSTPMTEVKKYSTVRTIGFPPIFSTTLVAWGSAAIGDAAEEQGMREIYFADLEIFSILGVLNRYTVHVYGK